MDNISIHINIYALIIWLILLLGISYIYRQWRIEKLKTAKLEKVLKDTEDKIQAIQLADIDYKLNPHLFKNVLNAIQSHAYQTYHSLDSLSNVLDYILYESKRKYVSPSQEIDFAASLIEIYKIKLSPFFDLKLKRLINDNEPLLNQKLMAPLISIDLIENAFKHADLQSANSFIAITFEFRNNIFALTVANKVSEKKAFKKENHGYGTNILKQRLEIIYKDNFTFDKFIEDDVHIAHLKIDLLEHKAKMLAAR
ncbi:histidine kinase [Sphingobacterium sp. Mn56C]|uniref:histidine kinase n=1 Tax=Sphingobacterium sp. Mn56C TaxID=3395261 RepID=UPI003BC61CEB